MVLKVKLSQAKDEYLRFSQARGLADNSVKQAKYTLEPLLKTTGDIYVSSLTVQHIENMFTKYADDWSAVTRNVRLTQLRGFFKWCDQRRYKDPMTDLLFGWRGFTEPEKDRLRIPVSEWGRLFAACQSPTDTAALGVGLYMFLRVSEMRMLKVGDIDLTTNTATVYKIKTKSRDELPISQELSGILREYLAWYTEHLAKRGVAMQDSFTLIPPRSTNTRGWLLGLDEDPPLRYTSPHTTLGSNVKALLLRAGYEKAEDDRWGGHVLRRSGARALFDELVTQGYDGALKTVQAMLGHKASVVTERYLGITLDREKRNQLLAGKPMFPSLGATNVVQIRRQA